MTEDPEHDGTLDLTKVKLTLGQMFAVFLLVAGLISTSAISLYQLSEVRKAQTTAAALQLTIDARLHILELDKARHEGIEYGQTHPKETQ